MPSSWREIIAIRSQGIPKPNSQQPFSRTPIALTLSIIRLLVNVRTSSTMLQPKPLMLDSLKRASIPTTAGSTSRGGRSGKGVNKEMPMNELLQRAIAAHGGLDRFNQFKRVSTALSIGGALWSLKTGQERNNVHVTVDLH